MALPRIARALLAGAVVALTLTACAATPPVDAWVIRPIAYEPALDGEIRQRPIDVTYPMPTIAEDTGGGFWTESSGSWLHVGASGETLRRFNLRGAMEFLRVRAIAALDPETLIVSASRDGESQGGLYLFDTDADTWTPFSSSFEPSPDARLRMIGDVAVVGDDVLYVDYRSSGTPDITFVIRRIDAARRDAVVSPELPTRIDGQVHLAAAPDTIVAVTETTLFRLDPHTGEVAASSSSPGASEAAVNGDGTAAWVTASQNAGDHWFIEGGSSEARALIENRDECELRSIQVDGRGITPALCHVQGIAWLDLDTLVVSVGTEGGAVIVRVDLPTASIDRALDRSRRE